MSLEERARQKQTANQLTKEQLINSVMMETLLRREPQKGSLSHVAPLLQKKQMQIYPALYLTLNILDQDMKQESQK